MYILFDQSNIVINIIMLIMYVKVTHKYPTITGVNAGTHSFKVYI